MKSDTRQIVDTPQDSVLEIVSQWKSDTAGCLRLRDADRIQIVIDRFELIGKDSATLIKYLGNPNEKLLMGDTVTVFYYFMGCSGRYKDRAGNIISGFNLKCKFDRNRLTSTWGQILD